MIVNIQSESDDRSTDDVITWINHLFTHVELNCIFGEINVNDINISISSKGITYKLGKYEVNEKSTFWYRRGIVDFNRNKICSDLKIEEKLYQHNIEPLIKFFRNNISNKKIDCFFDNDLSKLEQYKIAIQIGIKFPDTFILGNKNDLKKEFKIYKKLLTKGVKYPSMEIKLKEESYLLTNSSIVISSEDLEAVPDSFLPSLFQEYIEKQFEIRTFYLKGKFKSMAIFSQQNEKTKIDFRNYDNERPNRTVPFNLPKNIEEKLHSLMQKLNLETGSFDIIYTPKGEFYFLEVNPIGQFQWLSYNCNYFLERMIAVELQN